MEMCHFDLEHPLIYHVWMKCNSWHETVSVAKMYQLTTIDERKEILYIYILYRSQVEERQWVCWCRNWFWIGTDQYQAVPAPRAMVTPPLSIIIVNQPLTSRKLRISPRMQSKNICLSLFTDCAAPGPGWAKLPLAILQRGVTLLCKAVIEEGWIVCSKITLWKSWTGSDECSHGGAACAESLL